MVPMFLVNGECSVTGKQLFGTMVFTSKCQKAFVKSNEQYELDLSAVITVVPIQPYADCSEVHKAHPDLPSSIYTITLWNTNSRAEVVCDMDTDGGGWTVFQHRVNGSVDFYRNFSSYENGFGSLHGEFWLGLSLMHEMTSHTTNELRIDIQRANGSLGYVVYPKFRIEAAPTYILRIGNKTDYGGISSTSVDSFTDTGYGGAVDMAFTTFDRDNDLIVENCALLYHGAWWYHSCYKYANLNGDYVTPGTDSNNAIKFDSMTSLKTSRLMFRTA
ncbi:FCN1-like protein [Mya arenaria]|uniref:FCN1-like protein n=1 Tax=Mya arenaria TaxID=6604 RepID=A0ABY7G6R6_MYAAR|nr:FCN1-like protein [Mya arenaria]